MIKLYKWLNANIDKVCHFLVCTLIAILFSALILHTTPTATVLTAAICGFIASVICGLLKEVFDTYMGGYIDVHDLNADLCGAVFGTIIVLLIL